MLLMLDYFIIFFLIWLMVIIKHASETNAHSVCLGCSQYLAECDMHISQRDKFITTDKTDVAAILFFAICERPHYR